MLITFIHFNNTVLFYLQICRIFFVLKISFSTNLSFKWLGKFLLFSKIMFFKLHMCHVTIDSLTVFTHDVYKENRLVKHWLTWTNINISPYNNKNEESFNFPKIKAGNVYHYKNF